MQKHDCSLSATHQLIQIPAANAHLIFPLIFVKAPCKRFCRLFTASSIADTLTTTVPSLAGKSAICLLSICWLVRTTAKEATDSVTDGRADSYASKAWSIRAEIFGHCGELTQPLMQSFRKDLVPDLLEVAEQLMVHEQRYLQVFAVEARRLAEQKPQLGGTEHSEQEWLHLFVGEAC